VACVHSLQFDVDLVADLQSSRAKELSTQAEGKHATTSGHGVGVEVSAVELSTNAHLLEATELSRNSFGNIDDSSDSSSGRKYRTVPRNRKAAAIGVSLSLIHI